MTREELCKLVLLEADNIKKNCSEEEISKLDFEHLDPSNPRKCIYGQMTGSCFTERTLDLVVNLPNHFEHIYDYEQENIPLDEVLNAEATFRFDPIEEHKLVFSPIEVYITLPEADNENLINYIKGISKELNIN